MSLSERLKRIEDRVSVLERALEILGDTLADEVEEEEQPTLDLDGNQNGGERDQTQEL